MNHAVVDAVNCVAHASTCDAKSCILLSRLLLCTHDGVSRFPWRSKTKENFRLLGLIEHVPSRHFDPSWTNCIHIHSKLSCRNFLDRFFGMYNH